MLKLVNRVKTHHSALLSSILCNEDRRNLLKNVRENCIDVHSADDSDLELEVPIGSHGDTKMKKENSQPSLRRTSAR